MRRSVFSLVVGTILLTSPSVVQAGKISTPAISRSATIGQAVVCTVANTSNRAVGPFDITIFKRDGTVADSALGRDLAAGESTSEIADASEFGNSPTARCVVEGKGISKNKTPVTLCVTSMTDIDCQAAVSVP